MGPRCPFWLPPEWQRGAALTDLLRAVWEPAASLSVLINLCQKRPAVTRLGVFYGSGSALHLHVTLSRGFVLYLAFVLRLPAVRPLGGSRHNAMVLRAHPFNPFSVGPTHPRRVISAHGDAHDSWKPLWEWSGVRKGEIGISFQPGSSVSFVWHRGGRKVASSPRFVTRYKSSVGFSWGWESWSPSV